MSPFRYSSLSPRTEEVWGRSSQGWRWENYSLCLGPNMHPWPWGHKDTIMTQLSVYYHLPNLIIPNPKPGTPLTYIDQMCVYLSVCVYCVSEGKKKQGPTHFSSPWVKDFCITPANQCKMLLFQEFILLYKLTWEVFLKQLLSNLQWFYVNNISHYKGAC